MIQPKVKAGGISGAAALLIVWASAQLGFEVPNEVAGAFVLLIQFAGAYIKA